MIYAVNKRTLEHRIADEHAWGHGAYKLIEADPDGWIEWHGGECPLPEHAETEIRHRDRCTQTRRAGSLSECWSHEDIGPHDIVAYRPILDEQATLGGAKLWQDAEGTIPVTSYGQPVGRVGEPEPPAWDGEGERPPVGTRCMRGCEQVLILAYADVGSPVGPAAVYQSLDDPCDIDWAVCSVFAPIRSEEDRAVDDLVRIYQENESVSVRDAMRDIYRAGYRKQEAP